jgi:hypothetical protein
LAFISPVCLAEITGKVSAIAGKTATIIPDGSDFPVAGDPAELFLKLAGAEDEVSVAKGKALSTEAGVVKVEISESTGDVEKGQLVPIKSTNPQKRSAVEKDQIAPIKSGGTTQVSGASRAATPWKRGPLRSISSTRMRLLAAKVWSRKKR